MNKIDEFIELIEDGKAQDDFEVYCLIQDEGLNELVKGYCKAGYEVKEWMVLSAIDINDVDLIKYLSYEITFSGEALYRSFLLRYIEIFRIITSGHYVCDDRHKKLIAMESIRLNRSGQFSPYLNCLLESGFDFNFLMHNNVVPLYYYIQTPVSEEDFDLLMKKGVDPFATIYVNEFPEGIPLMIYAAIFFREEKQVKLMKKVIGSVEKWNWTDQWGRNGLHISGQYGWAGRSLLLEMGVDPDHVAMVDSVGKAVIGKMKGKLPNEYGKSPKELLPKVDWV